MSKSNVYSLSHFLSTTFKAQWKATQLRFFENFLSLVISPTKRLLTVLHIKFADKLFIIYNFSRRKTYHRNFSRLKTHRLWLLNFSKYKSFFFTRSLAKWKAFSLWNFHMKSIYTTTHLSWLLYNKKFSLGNIFKRKFYFLCKPKDHILWSLTIL